MLIEVVGAGGWGDAAEHQTRGAGALQSPWLWLENPPAASTPGVQVCAGPCSAPHRPSGTRGDAVPRPLLDGGSWGLLLGAVLLPPRCFVLSRHLWGCRAAGEPGSVIQRQL